MIRRREFIAGLGSAAAWPLAARGQRADIPVIGYLTNVGTQSADDYYTGAFQQGLAEIG
jgi:putative ABC transport system substrate-binding protein